MGFGSWFRGLTNNIQPTYQSFFYKLGEQFSTNTISDAEAINLGYMTNSAWYSIARTCAEGVSSLPIRLGYYDSQGEIVHVESGEVYDFIFNPNQGQTLSEFWEMNCLYYFTNGEFYEYHNTESVGFMGQRMSLPPELMTVLTDRQNMILSNVIGYEYQDNGDQKVFTPEEILHCKMINPSTKGLRTRNGMSPLQAGQSMLNSSNNIETAISWYFENRGASTLIWGPDSASGMSMTPDDKKMLDEGLRMRIGGAKNMNRTMVSQSPIGGTVNLAASSTDMQMIDNYNLVLQRLCSLVKLPSILVNDNEQSTYNNVVEAKKQAYNEVYIPTAEKFIKGYSRTWLKQWRERTGIDYVMYVDTSKIKALSVSPEERRREARADVQAGILTRNEARQAIGYDTLPEPEMDIPTIQSNLIPIQNIDNEAV